MPDKTLINSWSVHSILAAWTGDMHCASHDTVQGAYEADDLEMV